MESSVKQRLKEFIKYKGLSERQFCIRIGVSTAFVSNIVKSIQPERVNSITKHFPDLNPGWLLSGEGEMLRQECESAPSDTGKDLVISGKVIPFYDAEAAAGVSYGMDMTPSRPVGMIEIGGLLKDSESALRVYGNSMIPNYPAGCVVGVKMHTDSFIELGAVYVIETSDNRYLKRIFYNKDKTAFRCVSDNHMVQESGPMKGEFFYPDFEIPFSEVRRIFRVVGVIKRNIL